MEESAMISPTDSSVIVQPDLVDFDVKQVGDLARSTNLCLCHWATLCSFYSDFETSLIVFSFFLQTLHSYVDQKVLTQRKSFWLNKAIWFDQLCRYMIMNWPA